MSVYQHAGITILGKHDAASRGDRRSRVALVLAGGAITGGAFKAGGLRALDELLRPNMRLTDFDLFVGLSAGSVLASALAAGIDAEELFRITIGSSERFSPLRAYDFMRPNVREPAERIALFVQKSAEILGSYVSGREDPTHRHPIHGQADRTQTVQRARAAGTDRLLRSRWCARLPAPPDPRARHAG